MARLLQDSGTVLCHTETHLTKAEHLILCAVCFSSGTFGTVAQSCGTAETHVIKAEHLILCAVCFNVSTVARLLRDSGTSLTPPQRHT